MDSSEILVRFSPDDLRAENSIGFLGIALDSMMDVEWVQRHDVKATISDSARLCSFDAAVDVTEERNAPEEGLTRCVAT
jgi:hypothetical protein